MERRLAASEVGGWVRTHVLLTEVPAGSRFPLSALVAGRLPGTTVHGSHGCLPGPSCLEGCWRELPSSPGTHVAALLGRGSATKGGGGGRGC